MRPGTIIEEEGYVLDMRKLLSFALVTDNDGVTWMTGSWAAAVANEDGRIITYTPDPVKI